MQHGFESFGSVPNRPLSTIEHLTRPDGVKVVELTTPTDKVTLMLRNGEPYITSTTGTKEFSKLSPEDQLRVREALEDTQLTQE